MSPGEDLAHPRFVYYVVLIAFVVGWICFLYSLYTGRLSKAGAGDIWGLAIAALATLAVYDGGVLAVREYGREHNGRVTPGIVLEKLSSTGANGSRRFRTSRGRRDWDLFFREGFRLHEIVGRVILTGSANAWVIDYQYGCDRPWPCRGRDFVSEALWRQTYATEAITVRRSHSEMSSARLDENPQWKTAIIDLGVAAGLLVAALGVSGRLKRRGPRYLTAPAVVTAIEPLRSGDEPAWRIKFAYFDAHGEAHEGTDEVVATTFKAGDDGLAVFPPDRPELATFRPLETA